MTVVIEDTIKMFQVFNESSSTNFGLNQNITSNSVISMDSMLDNNISCYLMMTIVMMSVYILFYGVFMLAHLTMVSSTDENTNTIVNESITETVTVIDIKGEYDEIVNQIEESNSKNRKNMHNAASV